ncbi:hypothetical protein M2284_002136 [Rhodococcus sp. LBL1]|nr:hypothetical protein [Rhodococcus sp. LBL1]MDH6683524.1 hypothetical protein [Rhodococcus sp. LBL2]
MREEQIRQRVRTRRARHRRVDLLRGEAPGLGRIARAHPVRLLRHGLAQAPRGLDQRTANLGDVAAHQIRPREVGAQMLARAIGVRTGPRLLENRDHGFLVVEPIIEIRRDPRQHLDVRVQRTEIDAPLLEVACLHVLVRR